MQRHNLSTIWYRALPKWDEHNTKVPQRKSFTSKIKKVCEERFGLTREAMGIYAKPRATMYFKGQRTAVSFDKISELADNGTDIIFIEKDDVVELLTEYADKYGIALVDTQGFFTDYGKKLVVVAEESGANAAVLSDYDASGIKLAHDAGDIPRLGVDKDMIDYFGLNINDKNLTIPHRPKIDVMTRIKDMVTEDVFNFLKQKKIEIDAVIAQVGNKRFWDYLIKKLQDHYPTRDYTRVNKTAPDPSSFYPQPLKDINSSVHDYINLILDDEEKVIESELEDFNGIIEDIGEKDREIDERYQAIVDKNETLKELDKKLTTEIIPLLDKLNELTHKISNERLQKEEKKKEKMREFSGNNNLRLVEGVGAVTERLLKENGITTISDLASIETDKLISISHGDVSRAREFKNAAKKLLDDWVKNVSNE